MSSFAKVVNASWPPVLVFLFLALGFIWGDRHLASQAYDQNLYHIQAVRQFEGEWPLFNLADFSAATGPGYHIAIATAAKVVGPDLDTLRLVSMTFGVGLLVVMAGMAAMTMGTRAASLIVMPLATSLYVIGSGVYIHTDNSAWMCAALAIGMVVFFPISATSLLAAACFAAIAVSIRQTFIWAIGPIIFAGILASPLVTQRFSAQSEVTTFRGRWSPLFGALAASVPAVLMLAVFVSIWGGVIQEQFRGYHSSELTWCAFGYGLAVLGVYAPFFVIALPNLFVRIREQLKWIVIGGLLGAFVAVLSESVPNVEAGRSGGPVWMLAGVGPAIAERSLSLALLAMVGGGALGLLIGSCFQSGRGHASLVVLCTWVAVLSTQVVNQQQFQRYFDTPALIVLIWLTVLIVRNRDDAADRVAFGPPLLAVLFAGMFMIRALGL